MKKLQLAALGFIISSATAYGQPTQVGAEPIPVVNGITVQTTVSLNPVTDVYTYGYTVNNPATNTGNIWDMEIDLTAPVDALENFGKDLTIPRDAAGNIPFSQLYQEINGMTTTPLDAQMVPFGITVPAGWSGTLTVNGYGGFAASDGNSMIMPGQTVSGFNLVSHGVPTIRVMHLMPDWDLAIDNDEATEAEAVQASQVEQSLVVTTYVIAPSATPIDSVLPFNIFDQLQRDIPLASQAGWIPDSTFAASLTNSLQSARNIYNNEGSDYNAFVAVQNVLTAVNTATPAQLSPTGQQLLSLELTAMLGAFGNPQPTQPPSPPPPTPKVQITSPAGRVVTLPVGSTATITASVVDQAKNNAPLANYAVPFSVDSGPDSGMRSSVTSDQSGNVTYSYVGQALGIDKVAIHLLGFRQAASVSPKIIFRNPVLDSATVVWTGGADLILTEFTPPYMAWDGHSQIHITDTTKNIGNAPVGPSHTIYYLSTSKPIDPTTATVVGERTVPALTPGQSDFFQGDFAFPSNYQQPGDYYLTACANGDRSVVETDYANNCQIREVVMTLKQVAQPPNCSGAGPTIASLWPPNHKFVAININGITDPNNPPLSFTTTVTSIHQDEPVDEPGSGHTGPDGQGIGTATAQVRAERSGTGTGRIYFIGFTATNTANLSCSSTVQLYVPHDKGQGTNPVDTGQRYDSTQP